MDVLAVGSDVWVRDDKEGWLKARVTKTDGPKVTVKTEQEDERVVDGAQCPLQNSDGRSGVEVRSTSCRRHVAKKRNHVVFDLHCSASHVFGPSAVVPGPPRPRTCLL